MGRLGFRKWFYLSLSPSLKVNEQVSTYEKNKSKVPYKISFLLVYRLN